MLEGGAFFFFFLNTGRDGVIGGVFLANGGMHVSCL